MRLLDGSSPICKIFNVVLGAAGHIIVSLVLLLEFARPGLKSGSQFFKIVATLNLEIRNHILGARSLVTWVMNPVREFLAP